MLATMVLHKQQLPRGTVQRPDGRGHRRRLTFLVDSGGRASV